jgi:glutaredoxin-like YruB-family protein
MSVVLYSTSTCSYCVKAKEFLQQNRIPFTEYNVGQDLRKADEMVKKSGQMGVPVLDINGKIIVGFNQPEIERAIKR